MKSALFLFIGLAVSTAALLSNALGDHMVLQREPFRSNLWGTTAAGAKVVCTVSTGETAQGIAGGDGRWIVTLPMMNATKVAVNITVVSSNGEKAILNNILFGDVYVCGGQSNMEMPVGQTFDAAQQIALANNYPNVRTFVVGQGTISPTPLSEFQTIAQGWTVVSSANIPGFSAVCWYYGRNLYDSIQVPIGLISDNWGGTIIQAWSSPDALAKCVKDEHSIIPDDHSISSKQVNPNQNSVLWNAMIYPLLTMRIKGAIWYQGESNAPDPKNYMCSFPAMITDWRAKWGQGDFYFFFVQLAPWAPFNNDLSAEIRVAQIMGFMLPNVGFATAVDLGDIDSPYNNIHPRNKTEVGRRLSLAARSIAYHQEIEWMGPFFKTWTYDAASLRLKVFYEPSSLGSGLTTHAFACPSVLPPSSCQGFEMTADGVTWYHADYGVVGDHVELLCPPNWIPIAVRYLWSEWPATTVFNKDGLPAYPFSTAAW